MGVQRPLPRLSTKVHPNLNRNLCQKLHEMGNPPAGMATTVHVHSIFAKDIAGEIPSRWDDMAAPLVVRFAKTAELLVMDKPRNDVLTSRYFPEPHWLKICGVAPVSWTGR